MFWGPYFLTKFPLSPVKKGSQKRRTKLKSPNAKKFLIDSIYKLLRWTLQALRGRTISVGKSGTKREEQRPNAMQNHDPRHRKELDDSAT